MSDNYEDILNRSVDELPEPKNLPAGSWVLKAQGAARFVPAKDEGQKSQVMFFYEPIEPMDDVDDDDLAALGDDYDYANNTLVYKIWIERDTDWSRVVNHIKLHGVDTDGLTVKEAMAAVKSARIIGGVKLRTYTDKQSGELKVVNDVTTFAEVA